MSKKKRSPKGTAISNKKEQGRAVSESEDQADTGAEDVGTTGIKDEGADVADTKAESADVADTKAGVVGEAADKPDGADEPDELTEDADKADDEAKDADADEADDGATDADKADDEEEESGEAEDESKDKPAAAAAVKIKLSPIDSTDSKRLPLTIIACLLGAVIGAAPAALYTYFFESMFFPLFVIAPLLAYLLNRLLKGCRDCRAFAILTVFSLTSAYTTLIACRAAVFVLVNDMPIIDIPTLVGYAFGRAGAVSWSPSTIVYPLVFTVLGIFLAWELLRAERVAKLEPEASTEASSDEEGTVENLEEAQEPTDEESSTETNENQEDKKE